MLQLSILLLMCTLTAGDHYADFLSRIYVDQKFTVDKSAATICYVVKGKLEEVKSGSPDHGYTCDVEVGAPTADKDHALDLCESTFPHYIVEAEPKGSNTRCKFIILVKCLDNYYAIYEKCYVVFENPLPYQKAKELCATVQGSKTDARLAVFSSQKLKVDLEHLDLTSVWMEVPDLNEYFANGQDEGGAVYLLKASWKFDKKEGTLELVDPAALHAPLCEYTPKMTLAYLIWTTEKYKDLYPVTLTGSEITLPSDLYGGLPSQTDRDGLASSAKIAMGFNATIDLWNAFSIRVCPPDWLMFERANGQIICHMAFRRAHSDPPPNCQIHGAHLTGFDSKEELEAVIVHFNWLGMFTLIGGSTPCNQVGCSETPKSIRKDWNGKKADKYNFGWDNGMASNLEFIYQNLSPSELAVERGHTLLVVDVYSSRKDDLRWRFWIDPSVWSFPYYICGKFADI